MFRFIVVLSVLACTAAFMPTNVLVKNNQFQMSLEVMKSKLSKALGVAAMGIALSGSMIPNVVNADGARSASTVYRSRNYYGPKILKLEEAANKGDFSAFEDKKSINAFDLFISATNSLGGKVAKDRQAAEKAIEASIYSAVKDKDAAKLKASLADFIKVADLKSEYSAGELGQTDSSGYAPTYGTSKQYIYQR